MPITVTFYGLVSCVAMFKIPLISHVLIFSFIYRALSETTVSTFQAKTDQLFKLLISMDIRDETGFEPNQHKTVQQN